jgi:DNA-binding IclR family transcriptional regulator
MPPACRNPRRTASSSPSSAKACWSAIPATRTYRLGPLLYEFGLAAAPRVDARRLCGPTLDRLAAAAGDAAYLNCRSGNDALCLDRREGTFEVQALPVDVGNRRPLGVGSGALAVLASLPSAEVDAVIEANAGRYRRHGLTAERVHAYVEATRARASPSPPAGS